MLKNTACETADVNKPLLIVLLGPTAVGKTAFSLHIAKHYHCEIISGDSMQVYRQMDIGTAKASEEERATVPHHLIDVIDPSESFSVMQFQELASEAIEQITARQRIPLLVGGTGLYIESLCYEFQMSPIGADHDYRQQLLHVARVYGNEALHDRLRQIDPLSADRIHMNDLRRIIRALEVYKLTGQPISAQRRGDEKGSRYDLCLIGLTMDRAILYKRIEERVDIMLARGLLDEVSALLAQGYSPEHTAMQAIGYKEIIGYIQDEYDWSTTVSLLKRNSRRYAKRQLSWFRRMDDVHWVDVTDEENFHAHLTAINGIINSKITMRRQQGK